MHITGQQVCIFMHTCPFFGYRYASFIAPPDISEKFAGFVL